MANESKESGLQSSLQQNYEGMYGYAHRINEYSAFARSDFHLSFLGVLFHDPADVPDKVFWAYHSYIF